MSENKSLSAIVIEGRVIQQIEYRGQPVVTLSMVDELHQRPDGTAKRNFRENRERFIPGEDFFEVPYEEWKNILVGRNSSFQNETAGGHRGSMIFLTESGYLMLVKSFTDDRSWNTQRQLVKCYFRVKEESVIQSSPPPKLAVLAPEAKAAVAIAKAFGFTGNQAVLSANALMQKFHGQNLLASMDQTYLICEVQEKHYTASDLGKTFLDGLSGVKANQLLQSKGLIEAYRDHKNRLQWKPTEKGLLFCVLKDTGKKHGNGTPVQAIFWLESVVDQLSSPVVSEVDHGNDNGEENIQLN